MRLMSAAARAVTPVTVPGVILSLKVGRSACPRSMRYLGNAWGRRLESSSAMACVKPRSPPCASRSLKGGGAILIQEPPDDEKLVTACRRDCRIGEAHRGSQKLERSQPRDGAALAGLFPAH